MLKILIKIIKKIIGNTEYTNQMIFEWKANVCSLVAVAKLEPAGKAFSACFNQSANIYKKSVKNKKIKWRTKLLDLFVSVATIFLRCLDTRRKEYGRDKRLKNHLQLIHQMFGLLHQLFSVGHHFVPIHNYEDF